MVNREILGIYLDEENLHYASVVKGMWGVTSRKPSPGLAAFGRVHERGPAGLSDFLRGIKPSRGRHIYLSLPRERFYVRDLILPPMPEEEALESVESTLTLYSHLPLEEIYYDIHLSRRPDKRISGLILYAPRREIDAWTEVFKDTGHLHSLWGIFPASLGVGAWLSMCGYNLPMGVVLPGRERSEMAVFGKKGPLYSMTFGLSEPGEMEMVRGGAEKKFPEISNALFHLDGIEGPALPPPRRNRFRKFPDLLENMAVGTVATALSGFQQISVDPSPPRIKVARPMRYLLLLAVLLAAFCYTLTLRMDERISRGELRVAELNLDVKEREKSIAPLEARKNAIENADRFKMDVDRFLAARPSLFTLVNSIATLVPEGTWFSNLLYRDGVLSLKGMSREALKVIEELRKSDLFEQVKLKGSVSRQKSGEERFNISITLKGGGGNE